MVMDPDDIMLLSYPEPVQQRQVDVLYQLGGSVRGLRSLAFGACWCV